MPTDDTADARKVAEEIRRLWRDYRGGAVSDDQRTQETAIRLLAYAERVREEATSEALKGVIDQQADAVACIAKTSEAEEALYQARRRITATEARAEAAEAKLQEAEAARDEALRRLALSDAAAARCEQVGNHAYVTRVEARLREAEAERDEAVARWDSERGERIAKDARVGELEKALREISDADPDAPEVESWKWLARKFKAAAQAALARPEAPTPEVEEAWPTSGDKATQEWRRIREERHGEPEMEP